MRVVAPMNTSDVSSKREDVGPAPVQSPLTLYSTLLSSSTSLTHTFRSGSTKGYIHVIQTSGYNSGAASGTTVRVSGGNGVEAELREGDGAYIAVKSGKDLKFENIGDGVAEILLFELE